MKWFEHLAVLFIFNFIIGVFLCIVSTIEYQYNKKERELSYKIIAIFMLLVYICMIYYNREYIFK